MRINHLVESLPPTAADHYPLQPSTLVAGASTENAGQLRSTALHPPPLHTSTLLAGTRLEQNEGVRGCFGQKALRTSP